MARLSLRELLDHAAEHRSGVLAFNVNHLDYVFGIMAPRRPSIRR